MQAERSRETGEISLFRPGWPSSIGRHRQAGFFAQRRPKRRGSQPTDAGRLLGGIAVAGERTVGTGRGAHRI